MYGIEFDGRLYWITCNGIRLDELGGFIEPISPERIIEEIKNDD